MWVAGQESKHGRVKTNRCISNCLIVFSFIHSWQITVQQAIKVFHGSSPLRRILENRLTVQRNTSLPVEWESMGTFSRIVTLVKICIFFPSIMQSVTEVETRSVAETKDDKECFRFEWNDFTHMFWWLVSVAMDGMTLDSLSQQLQVCESGDSFCAVATWMLHLIHKEYKSSTRFICTWQQNKRWQQNTRWQQTSGTVSNCEPFFGFTPLLLSKRPWEMDWATHWLQGEQFDYSDDYWFLYFSRSGNVAGHKLSCAFPSMNTWKLRTTTSNPTFQHRWVSQWPEYLSTNLLNSYWLWFIREGAVTCLKWPATSMGRLLPTNVSTGKI